jgi:hypothetical protein
MRMHTVEGVRIGAGATAAMDADTTRLSAHGAPASPVLYRVVQNKQMYDVFFEGLRSQLCCTLQKVSRSVLACQSWHTLCSSLW